MRISDWSSDVCSSDLQCQWQPDAFLDIGPAWDRKYKAFECMAAQQHLWEYYTRVALQRGNQGQRNTGVKMTYGEAYQRVYPQVLEVLGARKSVVEGKSGGVRVSLGGGRFLKKK